MSSNAVSKIINEIDSRLGKLNDHKDDEIVISGNQYDELNQALSKVIGAALVGELESLKSYIKELQ